MSLPTKPVGRGERRGRVFGLCRASVCDSGPKSCFPVVQGAALAMPPFAAVMAHGTMPRPAPKLANGQTQLSLAITRWTRVRGHKSVPEFTANAFVDHHWRIGAVSICRPKSLNSLGCSGGKASQTTNFMRNDKAKAHATVFVPRVIHGRARIRKSTRHYSNTTRKPRLSPRKTET